MAAEPGRAGDQALPKRVGRYEAFLQIGAGGMARVYLAVQQGQAGQAQLVVVKVLRPEAIEDEHVLALFMDEARIAMRLSHPNVIRTREVIAEPPDYLLAMDFQNGQSLLQVLRRLGRQAVPRDEHIYILSKVLAGLSYAHELKDASGQPVGIVHRDVSPANVLVKATGALAATQDGVVKGKLGYAAPEQCLGKPADPRSDIYAVGVMLWEAIAGRRRASGETWQSVLQARLEDAEPRLEAVCPNAPEALTAIARKALARDPEDRYATAQAFQADLERYLAEKQGTKIGSARIAAMLTPHFDQDRADQHRSVEAFLSTLRSAGSGPRRRVPLPGGPAASRRPALAPAPGPAAPAVEEEQTSRIPVDTALLIMSRHDTATPPDSKSPTSTTPPSRASVPTSPAPRASASPRLCSSVTTTAPPPRNTVTTTAPPPLGVFPPPSAALPSVELGSFAPQSAPPSSAAPTSVAPSLSPAVSRSSRASAPSLSFAPASLASLPPPSSFPHSPARASGAALPGRKARPWPALLVLGGAIGLAAVGALTLRKPSSERAVTAQQPTPGVEHGSSAATRPTAPKVDTVNVRISVDPADAVVKLDGRTLSSNPFVASFPKDNLMHELTAFAEGCRDAKQVVHLNQNVDLLVALKRLKGFVRTTAPRSAAAARARAPALAPPSAEAHPATPAAEPGTAPEGLPTEQPAEHAADEGNPYGQ